MNEIKSKKSSIENPNMKYSSSTHLSYSIGQMVKQFLEVAFWYMINDPLVGFLSDKSKRFTKPKIQGKGRFISI